MSVEITRNTAGDVVSPELSEAVPADRAFRNAWILDGDVIAFDLAAMKSIRKREIRQRAADTLQAILDAYPPHERQTWERQLAQARAFAADASAETPMLDTLADKRGLTRQAMAAKVVAKAAQFEALAADAVGTQQALEDQIDDATTADEVRAVTWPA